MRADYVWQGSYQAAILETDDNKLPNSLQAAKAAIDKRIHELQTDHGGTPEEWQAITDALGGLNVLRRMANTLPRNRVEQCLRECNNSHYLKAAGVGAAGLGGDGRPVQNRPIGVTSGLGVELRGWEAENPSRNPSASACEPFQGSH